MAAVSNVDFRTGQVQREGPSYADLVDINERLKSELDGYRLKLAQKERDDEEREAKAPKAREIRQVLDHWNARICKGAAKIVPGSKRWKLVEKALKHFSVAELQMVPDGALLSDFHRTKRAYLMAESLYADVGRIESHMERALEADSHLYQLAELPEELRDFKELGHLCARCECGHLRLAHSKPDPARGGYEPCLIHGCDCADVDTYIDETDRWLAEQARYKRQQERWKTIRETTT